MSYEAREPRCDSLTQCFPGELGVISSPAHFRYLRQPPRSLPHCVPTSPLVITLTIFPSRASDLALSRSHLSRFVVPPPAFPEPLTLLLKTNQISI